MLSKPEARSKTAETVADQGAAELPGLNVMAELSPDYAKLQAKRQEINDLIAARQREVAEILTFLHTHGRVVGSHELAVAALLGDVIDDPGIAAEIAEKRGRLGSAQTELAVAQAALEKLQRGMHDEINRASMLVCDRVRPLYAARIAAICDALVAAHAAQLEYHELVDALTDAGVRWTHLNPMPPSFLGDPRDWQGRTARYLKEAAQHGFIDAAVIPERLASAPLSRDQLSAKRDEALLARRGGRNV